jgi:hypothetical protein
MIKKLKIIICFAAALTIGVHAVSAQNSVMNTVTNGRFSNEVDKFFSVTDWADMDISKWVSYLKMGDITKDRQFADVDWQAGLGIKLEKAYLSLYYNGRFNRGTTNQGTWGVNAAGNPVEPDLTADYNPGTNVWAGGIGGEVNHRNFFGLLLGMGAHGFKLTLDDQTAVTDIPKIRNTALITNFRGSGKDVPVFEIGSFQSRRDNITPTLQWGAAQDMTFGKFTTRPNAKFYMIVAYNDVVVRANDTDIYNHNANSLTPGLVVDTGGVTIWQGGWGKLKFGLAEEIAIKVTGDGSAAPDDSTASTKRVAWEDRLEPYTSFSVDFTKNLKLGSKLTVPLWFGYDNAATPRGFFGVGAKGEGATVATANATRTTKTPTWGTGFQYTFTNDGLFGNWVEKLKADGVVSLNFGILVNLPAYLFTSQFTKNAANENGTEARSYVWYPGVSASGGTGTDATSLVQTVTIGTTFKITQNFTVDFSWARSNDQIAKGGLDWNNIYYLPVVDTFSLMVSAKY